MNATTNICTDFSKVFEQTKAFIDLHNKQQTQLTQKINANHRDTAELIIRLYLKQLRKLPNELLDRDTDLPGFKTFNTSLAKCKGCTIRTIINHKERLKIAGIIIKEEHRGAQGIELWINPNILKTKCSPTDFSLPEVKIFHPLVHEQHEQRNNNSKVDNRNLAKGVRSKADGYGKTKGTRHEQDMNTGENAVAASKVKNNLDEAARISLLAMIQNFWELARKILYLDLIMSDPEERDILNHIWRTVYGCLQAPWTLKQWHQYHEQALERVVMVRKWLDRSPERWIPPPHIYFHESNDKNGFQNTIQWLLKRDILKAEVKAQLQLQRIKKEQELHAEGKGRYQHLNRLQLFRLHEQRLRKYKDPAVLESYYHQVLRNQRMNNS